MHLFDQYVNGKTYLEVVVDIAIRRLGSIQELRKALDITQQSLWRYMHSKAAPNRSKLQKLLILANVEEDWQEKILKNPLKKIDRQRG
jgi:transcriptional regulator with XRE-family HTH domain